MRIVKQQVVMAAMMMFYSLSQIIFYHLDGRIVLMGVGTAYASQAEFYYYVMWLIFCVGIVLLATSWRRKK